MEFPEYFLCTIFFYFLLYKYDTLASFSAMKNSVHVYVKWVASLEGVNLVLTFLYWYFFLTLYFSKTHTLCSKFKIDHIKYVDKFKLIFKKRTAMKLNQMLHFFFFFLGWGGEKHMLHWFYLQINK